MAIVPDVYAVLNNGMVINTVVLVDDPNGPTAAEFAAVRGWLPLEEGYGIGDYYYDGQFQHAFDLGQRLLSAEQQVTDLQLALVELYEGGGL